MLAINIWVLTIWIRFLRRKEMKSRRPVISDKPFNFRGITVVSVSVRSLPKSSISLGGATTNGRKWLRSICRTRDRTCSSTPPRSSAHNTYATRIIPSESGSAFKTASHAASRSLSSLCHTDRVSSLGGSHRHCSCIPRKSGDRQGGTRAFLSEHKCRTSWGR